jgi:hypothetical protein
VVVSFIGGRNRNTRRKPSIFLAHLAKGNEINQSETRIACGGHVCQQIGTK